MKFTKSWLISSLMGVAACGGTAEETVVFEGPGDVTGQPPVENAADTGANPGTDTGLLPNTKYVYELRSFNAAGTSYSSDRADATTQVAITAPTGVTATAGNWRVRVTWNAVSGADEYKVYRSTRSGGSYQLILYNNRDLELSDASVSSGTTYYYVVVAENSAGQRSAFSREVSATPRP